jgi:hypothetical protein
VPEPADTARTLVHNGATGEIHFVDGFEVAPSPIIALMVGSTAVSFFWLTDENEHVLDLGTLLDGDDGDVLVTNTNGDELRIWGIFEDADWQRLNEFVAAVKSGNWPPLGLDESWTRYKELD